MNDLPEPTASTQLIEIGDYQAMSIEKVKRQVNAIQALMKEVLKKGEHYGTIPGCGDKDALFQSGAQKICLLFKFRAEHHMKEIDLNGGHKIYDAIVRLIHIPSGDIVGEGVGTSSTMESKHRYRNAARKCPKCGAEAIIKGKKEYGGGFLCFKSKGGCGQKFADNDTAITDQKLGKVENEDPADQYNTCKKMAAKRAYVGATISATAASDIFTQEFDNDLAAEDAAIEAELSSAGSKNQSHLNEYMNKLHSFTDKDAMISWRTKGIQEIKKALSGQGELVKFNTTYEERIVEFESIKTDQDYINDINSCDSDEQLSQWWKVSAAEAQKVMGREKLESAWKSKKTNLSNPETEPETMQEPETEESATKIFSPELLKLKTSIDMVGVDVFQDAMFRSKFNPNGNPESLTEDECNLVSTMINQIMDEE